MPLLLSPVADYQVLITDKNLTVLGDPVYCWTSLDLTLRWNEPGAGILVTPGYQWILDQIGPGHRVVVIRNGVVCLAGPIEKYQHERSDDGSNAGAGVLTVTFADDFALIAARECYPDTTKTPEQQTTDNWTFSGNAELALRALVNNQAGPGATADRRIAALVLGPLAGVGSNVTVAADSMQDLGDVARLIGTNGGNLGFRTRQVGTQIQFQVYASPDKSGLVRFSFGLGNLRYISNTVSAPTATTAIVGGQGTGADRFMLRRTNTVDEAAWGRFEKLVSRPGNDPTQDLQDDGDQALADGASTTELTTNVSDLPDQMYGRDYDLGDIVAIESFPGQQVTDVVRTVHLQVYATSGEYVAATIGDQGVNTDPVWAQRLNAIAARLGTLERNVLPA